ncbi:hypothetical protein D3C72_1912480 [compost metagenome]
MATMSPASPTSIGVRSSPRKASTLETRPFSISLPSRLRVWIASVALTVPEAMRPVRMRPRKGLRSMVVTSMRKAPSSTSGSGTCAMTLSSSGPRSFLGPSGSAAIQPCLAEP